jgi:hypothetical protein
MEAVVYYYSTKDRKWEQRKEVNLTDSEDGTSEAECFW